MVEKNKILIVITVFFLLTAGLFLIIWLLLFKTTEPTMEEKLGQLPESAIRIPSPGPETTISEKFYSPETFFYQPAEEPAEEPTPSFKSEEFFETPVIPIPKPYTGAIFQETTLPEELSKFFSNIQEAAQAAEEIIEHEAANPTETSSIPISSVEISISSKEISVPMTEEEFNYFYPENFIASLMDAQGLIKEYDLAYKPVAEIKTDSQIRLVEENIVKALFLANMLTKKEAETYITTIRFTLPQLQIMELNYRQPTTLLPRSKGLFLAGLIEKLQNTLVGKAQAGGGAPCGFCYVSPLCFQVGAPSPTPGINVWKAFCYCTGCLYGQGCLDFCTGGSAIWDPTTGICGCG